MFNLVIYFIKVSKTQIAAIARKTNNSSVQNNWYLMLFERDLHYLNL